MNDQMSINQSTSFRNQGTFHPKNVQQNEKLNIFSILINDTFAQVIRI